MNRDNTLLIKFLKRNLPSMAPTFDEGIGIASERYFMEILIKRIMRTNKIQTILELPVDGSMGIPGMNSVPFTRLGGNVTITAPYKPVLDNAKKFWGKLGLSKKVRYVYDPKLIFPFKNNSFDLVWNNCLFEHFKKDVLLGEMKRISNKYILIVGQNRYNYGYPIHIYYHKKNRQVWDHGYPELMDLANVKKLIKMEGLKIKMSGFIDIPPWPDTFDMHTRGLGKKLVKNDKNWYWSSLQKEDFENLTKSKMIKILNIFKGILIFPFDLFFAHHYYVLAEKISDK